jgi:hypothetical protein
VEVEWRWSGGGVEVEVGIVFARLVLAFLENP